MAIEVITNQQEEQKSKPFPKLMIGKGGGYENAIVFFIDYQKGVTVLPSNLAIAGGYAHNWPMEHFEDYNEPITIKNA